MEYSLHNYGYWISGARTVFIGQPDQAAEQAWADQLTLKKRALDKLTAGRAASDVYAAVVAASAELGIPFWQAAISATGSAQRSARHPFSPRTTRPRSLPAWSWF